MGASYKCTSYCLGERERKGFLVYDLGYDPNLGATSYYTICTATQLIEILSERAFLYFNNCTTPAFLSWVISSTFFPDASNGWS